MDPRRKKKVFALLLFAVILGLPLGVILGYSDQFDNFDEWTPGCNNCHGSAPTESATGYIEFNITSGANVTMGEAFAISIQVRLFSEANGTTITLGFVDTAGDNAQFSFTGSRYLEDSVVIDSVGNSTAYEFILTAPSTAGSYTLVAHAMESDGSDYLNYSTGNVIIIVQAPDVPTYEGLEVLIIAGCILAAALVMAIVLYQRRK